MRQPLRDRWLLAVVALAATIPYLNALRAGFVFDDKLLILQNPLVTGPLDFWGILAAPPNDAYLYRPLTLLSYAVNEQLAPGSALWFHATNIVLHAGATLLVFALGITWCRSRRVALVASLLFAVHPIHSEAVTNVVGRAELLAAAFGLLALWAALRSVGSARPGWDLGALLAFAAALLSKESALTILPLIPLCRAAHGGGNLWRGLARELRSGHWIPFAATAVLFLVARTYTVGTFALPSRPLPLNNVLAHTPADIRIWTALAVIGDYAGLFAVPLVLSADYSWQQVVPVTSWTSLRALTGLGLVTSSLFAFLWFARRRPVMAVLAAFPLITLALTANLLLAVGTVKAERLLYLPSVGCVLLVALAGEAPRDWWTRRLPSGLLCLVLVAFGVRTWVRNHDWVDELTLYRSMVEAAPRSAKAHNNLAVVLEQMEERETAAIHFREALRLYPNYDESAFGLGLIYQKKGLANGAIAWYRKALEITPSHQGANTNLCGLLLRERDYTGAERACRHALRFSPTDSNMLKALGVGLLGLGDSARGVEALQQALTMNPADEEVRALLARIESGEIPSG